MALTNEGSNEIPFKINLIITHKHGKPCISLRRETTDEQIIKTLVSCAYHNTPITIMPFFTNPLGSLNQLIEKGIIYKKIMINEQTGEPETQFFYNY